MKLEDLDEYQLAGLKRRLAKKLTCISQYQRRHHGPDNKPTVERSNVKRCTDMDHYHRWYCRRNDPAEND